MIQMEAMKKFMVMQPSSFNEESNAEMTKTWLRHIKRILKELDIPKEMRVSLLIHASR